MILLVTASSRGKECAAALETGTSQKLHLSASIPQAIQTLRGTEYDAVLIDQSLLESDFRALDTLLNHTGTAIPVYVNLALHGNQRVVREARVALQRVEKERATAMHAAERELRNELRSEVTGILLTAQLALRHSAIPQEVAAKLELVHDMAEKMRARLHVI